MKETYQRSCLWFLVAVLMVPTAYGQGEAILGAYFMNGNTECSARVSISGTHQITLRCNGSCLHASPNKWHDPGADH